jgi:hypothetical protein
MNVSELCNLILVCIREGSHIRGSNVGNGKGVKGDHYEDVDCARVARFSPKIKESLMNNISYPVEKGKHIQPHGRTHQDGLPGL